MSRRSILLICLGHGLLPGPIPLIVAQPSKHYWQQEVSYKMEMALDVNTNLIEGRQTISYRNNSPDVLDKVYFHLYLNAFQPGSAMDVRSRTISDPDPRIGDRISKLKPDEIGYQRIKSITQNGAPLKFEVVGTILEVTLAKPVSPGQKAKFEMEYSAQVPVQIRRNGRDNNEGIRYSMSQSYPKLCEYDKQGWHANPYIGREFYGVWGDFNVKISIDAAYTVAATGELKNAKKIGHGYAADPAKKESSLTWNFVAKNVHDFMWAADPDYVHDIHTCADGLKLHSFYTPHESFTENWQRLLPIMEEAFRFINKHYGQYPYPVYSFIQGGDGGMEYPMGTLVTGHRSLTSLVGVSVHELLHSWYQMTLGFNESLYSWMDEGFTQYAAEQVMEHLKAKLLIPGDLDPFPYAGFYKSYADLVAKGIEEPLSTHADHYEHNSAYGVAAYVKGAIFLHQLEYIIGKNAFEAGMLAFFNAWKFKHPDDNDFLRIMEKQSGLELDWYKEYFIYSTKTIDYNLDSIYGNQKETTILLQRKADMPMPVDVEVELDNGNVYHYTIPLDIMRGAKLEKNSKGETYTVLPDWNWVNPEYQFTIPYDVEKIKSVSIDPTLRLADLDRNNNYWPVKNE